MAYFDKKKKTNKMNKIRTKLSLSTITNLIYYSLTYDGNVSTSNLANLQRLVKSIDIENSYSEENDLPTIEHLRLLAEILDIIVDFELDSLDELKNYILDRNDETYIPKATVDSIFSNAENKQFDEKKVLYWNKFIETQLDNNCIYKDIPVLKSIVEAFEHPDPKTMNDIMPLAKETLINLNRNFNINKMSIENKYNSFNITDRYNAKAIIKKSLESIYNPGNRIPSGYKLFDKMIGGGFQGERVYTLLGSAKTFKSGTMLNIAMNVVTHYDEYLLKDPDKTPAVLYFTMENSMIETFERIYHYLGLSFNFNYTLKKTKTGKNVKVYDITDQDVDDILNTIEKETIEKTGIALRIEFRTHMSVDTGELDRLYENYALIDNQEIIFIVQDYIKRIHSQRSYKTEQKREELGEVINEFCNFAKERHIPILTASQLNREAQKMIESAKNNKKKDIGRKLGSSMVGESSLIYENSDYTISIYREVDQDTGDLYQSFNLLMARGESYLDYFAQPYDKNPIYHNFKIATDYDSPEPLGVTRMSNLADPNDIAVVENSIKQIRQRKPIDLKRVIEEEEEIDTSDRSSEFM